MSKLIGKKLTVLNIYRTDMFSDSAFAHICENCGRTIINNAEVQDEQGKKYIIGLDCKKTLIDKPVIDSILNSNNFMAKYEAKEYKSKLNEVDKFLKLIAYPNTNVKIDSVGYIYIYDTEKINQFGLKGETIYAQNVHYLYKLGLKDFIQKMYTENKISYSK